MNDSFQKFNCIMENDYIDRIFVNRFETQKIFHKLRLVFIYLYFSTLNNMNDNFQKFKH